MSRRQRRAFPGQARHPFILPRVLVSLCVSYFPALGFVRLRPVTEKGGKGRKREKPP